MSKTTEQRHLSILLEMHGYIVNEVCSAELVEINTEWNNELDVMMFMMVFSTGENNYDITVSWDGVIHSWSKKMPKHLLVDIHNGICAGYLKGIMEESIRS